MTMIAAYCLILNTFVMRYAKGDQLNLVARDGQSGWKQSFDSCKDPNYWHQIFDNCQPESCNASKVADKIINKSGIGGRQQYWIYGYVLRSPIIVNIGCFSLNSSLKNTFHNGRSKFQRNSAFECSRACPNDAVNHIFLREDECLCIHEKKFISHQFVYKEEPASTCKQFCVGNSGDLCGSSSSIEGRDLYSVYEVIRIKISPTKIGDTCAAIFLNNTNQYRFEYTTCNANQMYICEGYNTSYEFYNEKCSMELASWYDARHNCQKQDSRLRLYTKTSSICMREKQMYWIGNHIAEKIIWANESLPEDTLCIKLVITASGSSLETESCNTELQSLCYTSQQTSTGMIGEDYMTSASTQSKGSTGHTTFGSPINTMPYFDEDTTNSVGRTTYGSSINTKSDSEVENTKEIGRTTLRGPVNAGSDSEEDKPDLIPIVAGSVGGFVAIVIVVIIVFIIQRRKKINNKQLNADVDEREPETYSEPIKNTVSEESRKLVIENTIPEDNNKLVNVTEEGIYNHLGDSEQMIEMKPQDSSIYDVTGDDEYHVFTGNEKQIIKDDDDLYDHGAASDVYNTLNDTVTTNRPESDTYNVINAK